MASLTGEQNRQLKRKLVGLSDEEKTKRIKEIALKEEMARYRHDALKKYRDLYTGEL